MDKTSFAALKDLKIEKAPWSYGEPIATVEKVSLRVPKKSDYMKLADAHSFEDAKGHVVEVPSRWIQRSTFSGKEVKCVVLRRNFYRITEADLGKMITATVTVCERKRGSHVETFLDITKTGNILLNRPEYDLQIKENAEGTLINGTLVNIHFAPRAPWVARTPVVA